MFVELVSSEASLLSHCLLFVLTWSPSVHVCPNVLFYKSYGIRAHASDLIQPKLDLISKDGHIWTFRGLGLQHMNVGVGGTQLSPEHPANTSKTLLCSGSWARHWDTVDISLFCLNLGSRPQGLQG